MEIIYYSLGLISVIAMLRNFKFFSDIFDGIMYQFHYNNAATMSAIWDNIKKKTNRIDDYPSKKGEIAIVTGGARGLGVYVVKGLMKCGFHVVVAVRNVETGKKICDGFNKEGLPGKASAMELDVSSMKSVEKFSKEVKAKYPIINILVNNAGVLFGDFRKTEDGFEYQLATNYIGHFYLCHLLMNNLKKAAENGGQWARIVNVGSCAHNGAKILFDDINMEKCYHPVAGYARSKLAQIMFTEELSRYLVAENIPVKTYCAHPGIVATDMFYNEPSTQKFIFMAKLFKTPEEGATSIVYACISPKIENNSGLYISNCEEGYRTSYAKNKEHQKRLFDMTCEMLKIKKFAAQ